HASASSADGHTTPHPPPVPRCRALPAPAPGYSPTPAGSAPDPGATPPRSAARTASPPKASSTWTRQPAAVSGGGTWAWSRESRMENREWEVAKAEAGRIDGVVEIDHGASISDVADQREWVDLASDHSRFSIPYSRATHRYPAPCTVSMASKPASMARNLRRMRLMWEVMVASSTTTWASRMSCSRLLT